MEQKEKEKCLQVIDILEQNEELKAFMDYNEDYFNDLKKKLNNNFYHSAAHFYESLTLRFFRPEDKLFRFLIGSFCLLCDSIVMENFGNSFVNFNGRIDSNCNIIVKNLHHLYIDLKKQKLVDNFRNYINESINLAKNDTKSEDHLKMKKLTDQTDDFSRKISYICGQSYNESFRLKDIRLINREGERKMIGNIHLKKQQKQQKQSSSTLTNIETDLDIFYPESEAPSAEPLPVFW